MSCAWISANSTLLVVPQWPSYHGEEGWKEILLLRVDPSRFPGIPNIPGDLPDHNSMLTSEGPPRGGWLPRPQAPFRFNTSRRGGGCYIFPVPAHSKMKIKRFWFCMIFFTCAPTFVQSQNLLIVRDLKLGYGPSAETWFSLNGLWVNSTNS